MRDWLWIVGVTLDDSLIERILQVAETELRPFLTVDSNGIGFASPAVLATADLATDPIEQREHVALDLEPQLGLDVHDRRRAETEHWGAHGDLLPGPPAADHPPSLPLSCYTQDRRNWAHRPTSVRDRGRKAFCLVQQPRRDSGTVEGIGR